MCLMALNVFGYAMGGLGKLRPKQKCHTVAQEGPTCRLHSTNVNDKL
jgi:hypothetical protein